MASTREGWRRARLETVLDLSLALAGPRREDEVVEELVHRAVGLLDARAGIALSLQPDLRPAAVAVVGWPDGEASPLLWLSSSALSGVRGGDVARLPGATIGLQFGELLIAPCLWRDELTGIVCVVDKETRAGQVAFDDEDERFLRSLALLAAPAIAAGRQLEQAERHRLVLEEENRALRLGSGEDVGLVGQARAFRQVIEVARRVAASDVTVLVRGESGTGKELVARLLHGLSARHRGQLVPLNCAAVPETLLEAELFGIEKGVATGVTARIGKFELANGGTLFLDEVGDLTPHLQAKLLRVVQEREVERVVGRQHVRVDVRLVAATNRDVEAMMAEGEFREDLYYRLRVVELVLPPLRERREDIPLLATYFVRLHGQRLGRGELRLSRAALELLLAHDYPGNIRELENLVEAAVVLADGPYIERADLELAVGRRPSGAATVAGGTLDDVVRAHVLTTLEQCRGSRSETARILGIDRSTLYRMLMRWNATSDAQRTKRSVTDSGYGGTRRRSGRV